MNRSEPKNVWRQGFKPVFESRKPDVFKHEEID